MKSQAIHLQLANNIIGFVRHTQKNKGIFLLRLHGNELQAQQTGLWWVKQYGGTFIDIDNANRELCFDFQQQTIKIDPNRIFSKQGITGTLSDYQAIESETLVATISDFSQQLLKLYQAQSCLIALHNNFQLSLDYYRQLQQSQPTIEIFQQADQSVNNFILVNQATDFVKLKQKKINCVYLNGAEDDPGSLSEYCTLRGIRYFNIETFVGDLAGQKSLLMQLSKII